jgi:hypothetical protein
MRVSVPKNFGRAQEGREKMKIKIGSVAIPLAARGHLKTRDDRGSSRFEYIGKRVERREPFCACFV